MRKLLLFLLALALPFSVSGQSCCDFNGPKATGGRSCFMFPSPWAMFDQPASILASQTLDAAGEKLSQHGFLYIDGAPTTTKTCSTSACTISFRTGAVTWATANSAVIVSLQDLPTATAAPAQPDETADVSFTFVQGTTAINANAWNTTGTMASGTKTVSHGQAIAVVFDMSVRNGADSVTFNMPRVNSGLLSFPSAALKTGGTWATSAAFPNIVITFDDGTLGWIDGTAPVTTFAVGTAFKSDSTPDEYGNAIKFPFPVEIDAIWWQAVNAAGGDYNLNLVADPLGARTSLASKSSIDGDWVRAASSSGYVLAPITKVRVGANMPIGVSVQPTTTTANSTSLIEYVSPSSTLFPKFIGAGTYGIAATDSGVFAANGTNTWRAIGVRACAISNGSR